MEKKIIHPYLFGIYPILFLLAHNNHLASIETAIIPCLIVLALTLICFLGFRMFSMNKKKVGIIISIVWILFFSFGHFHKLNATWPELGVFRYRNLIIFWGLVLLLSVFGIIRSKSKFQRTTEILNTMSIVLILMPIFNILIGKFQGKKTVKDNIDKTAINTYDNSNSSKEIGDIYYLVFDAYASDKVLFDILGYDNSSFTNFLKKKEFFVTKNSHSNYCSTFLSLASSLNMKYLNHLTGELGEDYYIRTIPEQMILHNEVSSFLKSRDYTFINISSGLFYPTNTMDTADIQHGEANVNEFYMVLLGTTLVSPFVTHYWNINQREDIHFSFDKIAEIADMPEQTFTLAHFICPHPPYVFGRNGEEVPNTPDLQDWTNIDTYIDQLIYTNKKIEQLINDILEKSDRPPIIILQADHGSAVNISKPGGWDQPTDIMLRERFGILNALYLPKVKHETLNESLSPVNNFRFIFNEYFDTEYEILEDRSYFSTYVKPYKFTDVSERLK